MSEDSDFTAGDGTKAGCRPEAVAVAPKSATAGAAHKRNISDCDRHAAYQIVLAEGRDPDEWIAAQGRKLVAGEPNKWEDAALRGPRWAFAILRTTP